MGRVAVDCMGGDHAPAEIVAGCVQAAAKTGVEPVLVGAPAVIRDALEAAGGSSGDFEIVEASEVVDMDDPDPARTVRSRRDNSVSVASRLVAQGRAEAVFSAGSTGAALAAAVLEMKRLKGVGRPAVAVTLPFGERPVVLVDAGASPDPRPEHLAGYALLGSVFAETALGVAEPKVALLNVGSEEGKGNDLAKSAAELMARAPVNFVGNVEGNDLTAGRADVVVTDGFTGNVVLKVLEGFSKFLMNELLEVFDLSDETRRASEVLLPGLLDLRARLSAERYGGAQLVGVRGVCIIGHGSSRAAAVVSALETASRTAQAGLVVRLGERLSALGGGDSSGT